MEEIENKQHLYTKGDRETVIRRFDMIHTLTMFCPIVDEGIKIFKNNLLTCLTQYMEKKDYFKQVPVMDVFVCFNKTLDYCKNNNISIDNIYSFWGVVQSFKNLKFLNLEFTSDENVLYAYEYIRGKEKDKSFEIIQHIYKIEVIELVLSNMFTQNVIDMLNKVMMFDEIISNSTDEYRRPDNIGLTQISVTVMKDNTIVIEDNGGIPVVKHKEAGIMVPQLIFGRMRTSSNYNDDEDRSGLGTNGVGSSLTNIFSSYFGVMTDDGKKRWVGNWKNNMSEFYDEEIEKSSKKNHGTRITFHLDFSRFEGIDKLDRTFKDIILTRCINAAAANPGLKVTYKDEDLCGEYRYDNFKDYIDLYRNYVTLKDCIEMKDEHKHVYVYPDGAINIGFVNGGICNKGTHVKALHQIINTTVCDFLKKKDKIDLLPRQVDGNYSMFCDLTISNPSYDSQTKECLTTPVEKFYKDENVKFELPNKFLDSVVKSEIIDNVRDWYKKKCEAEDQRTLRKLNKEASKGLRRSDKYVTCSSKKKQGKQLWIYEGDSAARGLRIGRDPETQAGYVMRGVPPNSLDMSPLQIMKNDVFNDIITILGLKFGDDFNINDLKFDKIVISTDADIDGDKIAALLLLLFSRWPILFEKGIVCRSITPIIIAKKGKEVKKYYSQEEFDKDARKLKGYMIKYVKGLSGLDASETKESMRNPIFMHFKIDDLTKSMFKKWFGKNSEDRKEMMGDLV